jgi:hypothetical protein
VRAIVGSMLSDRRGVASTCSVLVLAIFPLAGCGGKSNATTAGAGTNATTLTSSAGKSATTEAGSSESSSAADSEKRFIAAADPICRHVNVQLARSSAQGGTKTARERARYVAALLRNEGLERRSTGELARLTPPPALAADWAKMLGYRRTLASQLGELSTALAHKDKVAQQDLISLKKERHQLLREVAGKDGFKDCATLG